MASIPSRIGTSNSLILDGVNVGPVKSVTGGDAYADVIVERDGPTPFARKHIGQPKYEDITTRIGLGLAKPVYDWIASTWSGKPEPKAGAILATSATFESTSEREFTNALVTEVSVPACDASSKEAAFLTLKFAPERVRTLNAEGATAAKPPPQKQWLTANFRLELDGLDCSKVSRIEPFTVRQVFVQDDVGGEREPGPRSARLEFPNLRVTLSETGSKTWADWFEDFVLEGNSDESKEREGAIVFLASDLKAELGRIVLHHVGIFALRRPEPPAAEQVRRTVVDLYCVQMELKVGAPAEAPAPVPSDVPERILAGGGPRIPVVPTAPGGSTIRPA